GNWQFTGIISAYSGYPFTITANGGSLALPGANISQTADQVAPVQILGGINTGNPWFSTSSFAQPTGARYGTSGRNIFDGPGLFALNLSLFKDFKFSERWQFELRCDTFNFTNTPAFANPGNSNNPNQNTLGTSTYGIVNATLGSGSGVNGTGGGRAIQLAAKISF
ncbi:MAG: TonB-dependent receptor, partial [Acidobacteriaceae bacterium]|nr:TonB-dependent receptor [Acidobacteriaceae bacterium]